MIHVRQKILKKPL